MTNICSVISNVLCSLAAKVTNPPIGQKRDKIGTKEMHERNQRCLSTACCLHVSELSVSLRFYNKLPEVREQRQVQQRAQEYAKNRERAKQFNQVTWQSSSNA